MNKLSGPIIFSMLLLALSGWAESSQAAVLWSSNAEHLTCGQGESNSVWDYTESGDSPASRFYARCATPVPNSGRSNYYQVNAPNLMHDAWNAFDFAPDYYVMNIGTTYYLGGFFRFSRINGQPIWHDSGYPESADKLFEFNNDYLTIVRGLIMAGWPDWANCNDIPGGCVGKFTFGGYLGMTSCSTNCPYPGYAGVPNGYEVLEPNVPPYSRTNPFKADYEKWYAVVMGFKPSSGGDFYNGAFQLWVNGIPIIDLQNIKTQDSTNPRFRYFSYSGTIAQPDYDAPAHYRMVDQMMFADSLADMTAAGLMSDPEAGGAPSDTTPPAAPSGVSVI